MVQRVRGESSGTSADWHATNFALVASVTHSNDVLAIIPARGGSKGIPGKNLRRIGGKPLLVHAIDQARASGRVDRIVVSTDDGEIRAVAARAGAEVIDRPPELSDDTATSESALLHALDTLRDRDGYDPGLVVFLQVTSPLRRAEDITAAIDQVERDGLDSLFSASPVHGFMWRIRTDGTPIAYYNYRHRPRRQDTAVEVIENGALYVFRPGLLRAENNRLGGKIGVHMMDALQGLQIDEPGDIEMAERVFSRAPAAASLPDPGGIELLVLDFDGVLTDNRVLVDEHGRESALCNRGDGMGIRAFVDSGKQVLILSRERATIARARAAKLDVPCIDACNDKLTALQTFACERGIPPNRIAYVGNDLNDLACMQWVRAPIAVADAAPDVLSIAQWRTVRAGGYGAVREVIDVLLAADPSPRTST